MTKAAVLYANGLPDDTDRDVIKNFFNDFQTVSWVEYESGKTEVGTAHLNCKNMVCFGPTLLNCENMVCLGTTLLNCENVMSTSPLTVKIWFAWVRQSLTVKIL